MSQGESDFCWDSVAFGINWVSRSRDSRADRKRVASAEFWKETTTISLVGMCVFITAVPITKREGDCPTVCVSLFYVIDTGSIRPRARIPGEPNWGLPIYPPPLAQTLAMPIYPYPYWEPLYQGKNSESCAVIVGEPHF